MQTDDHIYLLANMVEVTPSGISGALSLGAHCHTEFKIRNVWVNFHDRAEHAALRLMVLPMAKKSGPKKGEKCKKTFLWHSSVSSHGEQPDGQMVGLHSPVAGFVALTVQEPDNSIVKYRKCRTRILIFKATNNGCVQTVMTPGWLAMFVTCVDVLVQTSIVSCKQLKIQK